MERVRKEVRIGETFTAAAFEAAFEQFRALYSVRPTHALCSPGVLERYCAVYERSPEIAHRHSSRITYDGIPLVTAVIAPGTIIFEGEVDDVKMGDW
jgi:hypothetical protein